MLLGGRHELVSTGLGFHGNYPEAIGSPGGYRGTHPVVNVNLYDVTRYIAWLNTHARATTDARPWRLPTEEEWEYVARAEQPGVPNGAPGPYWWGTRSPVSTSDAIATANCKNCDPEFPDRSAPVGHYGPNAFGLYDTVGNVWEWTDSVVLVNGDRIASVSSADRSGSLSRVLRGGGWKREAKFVRVSYAMSSSQDVRGSDLGFRVCRASLSDLGVRGPVEQQPGLRGQVK